MLRSILHTLCEALALILFLAGVLILLMANSRSYAAEFSVSAAGSADMPIVHMDGKIEVGDFDKLLTILNHIPGTPPSLLLVLDSPGGALDESYKLALGLGRMRGHGVFVYAAVMAGATCSSACVTIFAAASKRYVQIGGIARDGMPRHSALIAVHTPSIDDQEDQSTMAAAVSWVRTLKAMGAPDVVVAKLVETGTRVATRLTASDLGAWPNTEFMEFQP